LGGTLGQTEIENLGLVATGHENVGGLDVAVDDSLGMSGVESVGDLRAEIEQLPEFHSLVVGPAVDPVLERLAFQQLHGDEVASAVFSNLVDRADIWVVQSGGGASFALKTVERERIFFRLRRKELERDMAAQVDVRGFVHNAHPSAA